MEKIMLLEDVNLADIQFTNEGKNIHFEFLDMYQGNVCGNLTCHNVLYFKYVNSFFDENEGFACYVGEISVQNCISGCDVVDTLEHIDYPFFKGDPILQTFNERLIPPFSPLYLVRVEGSEVSIVVLCVNYEYKTVSK